MADKTFKERRKQRVLAVMANQSEPIKLSAILQQVGDVPERTLRRWLAHWDKAGIVNKSGRGKATLYTLPQSSPPSVAFIQPLDDDIQQGLLYQIRDLWTHHSTALEGNTLTLGDTHFILNEGLTISGKPIKDHQEVIGHSRAIDLVYQSLAEPMSAERLFSLHCAVQTDIVNDIYKPQGDWKLEPNGTYAVDAQGQQRFIQYALPAHVPVLMDELITMMNRIEDQAITITNAHEYYAKLHMGFVHIHPFWNGNGRMARLIANIPLLKAGLPPLVISTDKRREYIECLAQYQLDVGQLHQHSGIWPEPEKLRPFIVFCQQSYQTTQALVDKAMLEQEKRNLLNV